MSDLSHSDLVERAVRWLRNTARCRVVLSECGPLYEIPDAIGWTYQASYLIECKTSRADFFRDRHKIPRRVPSVGLGDHRLYMTPPGLIDPSELPDGWGLLEVYPKQVRKKVLVDGVGGDKRREIQLLISALASAEREQRERVEDCPHDCPPKRPSISEQIKEWEQW